MIESLASIVLVPLLVIAYLELSQAVLYSITDIPFTRGRIVGRLLIKSPLERRWLATISTLGLAAFFGFATALALTSASPSSPLERVLGAIGLVIEAAWTLRLFKRWFDWRSTCRTG